LKEQQRQRQPLLQAPPLLAFYFFFFFTECVQGRTVYFHIFALHRKQRREAQRQEVYASAAILLSEAN
jgi:hypothetical protein